MSSRTPRDFTSQQHILRANTAQRLQEIVEAAERAAEGVIDDAEAQARRYLEEARARADQEAEGRLGALSELTDSLLEEAAALRNQAERLQATLEEAKARLQDAAPADAPAGEPERPRVAKVSHLTPLAAVEGGETAAPEELVTPRQRSAAGARLLATQMAVSGSSREEIEQRLRNGFEIEDTSAILDAILGPED